MGENIIKLATGIILIIATIFGGTGSSTDNFETILYKKNKLTYLSLTPETPECYYQTTDGINTAQSNIIGNEFPQGPSCRFITD